MNASSTSFDPMDWYKKLTTCLATKKNCKVNLSRVPGGKEIKENKRLPSRITNQHLQNKFLAKYNEKRQQEPENVQEVIPPANALAFNHQKNAQNKRKAEENYINLPPTYFKSNVPDLSIFKVPQVPPAKKARVDADKTNNFTLESLFSGSFRPPKASTPVEELRPLISDPGDILNAINSARVDAVAAEKPTNEKFKKFSNLVDLVAKKIDTNCFFKLPDPLTEIINRLNATHDIATQSPRSSLCGNSCAVVNSTPQVSCRPIPVFYEEDNQHKEDETEMGELDSLFNKTFESVSIFPSSSRVKEIDVTPIFDMNSSPIDFLFGTSSPSPGSSDSESILMTQPTPQSKINEYNWLDEVFNNSVEFDSSDDENQESIISATNIFRSPPRSSRDELKKKFSQAINRNKIKDSHDVSSSSSIWSNTNDSVFNISLDLL